jgi:EAL domain-containing protein (putative c-di-GMP-specific phosphodiesterase class I)
MLPQGVVVLDREGRYVLWNQQYADIYKKSADLFELGVRLEGTLRIGVSRGDYPEASGREERIARTSGLAPERLELEVTEALLLENSESVLSILHAIRGLGVRISMDDFGTGYSSLSYLRMFPFDKIKIDGSFVRGIGFNKESKAIIRAIMGLGTSLGMTITAEGIETESEQEFLRAVGCDEGQGFLYSKARPVADVPHILDALNQANLFQTV